MVRKTHTSLIARRRPLVKIISTQGLDKEHYFDPSVDGITYDRPVVEQPQYSITYAVPRQFVAERVDIGDPVLEVNL